MFYPSQEEPLRALRLTGCFVLATMFFVVCLMPYLFVTFAGQALTNLHLDPAGAVTVLLGMFIGSVINLPIWRRPLDSEVVVPVFEPVGGWVPFPRYQRLRQEQVVAVNVGGCVIPVLLAVWLSQFIATGGPRVITVVIVGMAINTVACYALARPIPRMGIALPFFLPAMTALLVTWFGLLDETFAPYRAPVAFVVGITGPLIGADLLHWNDFKKITAGTVSIGGAGTWDGIVLSGLLAAFLA